MKGTSWSNRHCDDRRAKAVVEAFHLLLPTAREVSTVGLCGALAHYLLHLETPAVPSKRKMWILLIWSHLCRVHRAPLAQSACNCTVLELG